MITSRSSMPSWQLYQPGQVVERFMVDFELGAWNAISLFFPTAHIKECAFHWSQAVWRKIKELGLVVTYLRREATHRYLKQIMALPFLPAQDIPAAFQQLRDRVITDSLQSLVVYLERQWIQHQMFRPASWTVYRQTVRANNDVEGWHHRANAKVGQRSCSFYRLCSLLLREAQLVETRVSSDNLCRDVRKTTSATQRKLEEA
ncbi:uncharacterized protein LOC144621355 [Crassostrea virginica]